MVILMFFIVIWINFKSFILKWAEAG
jgi:hypothetical protein